MVNTLEKIQRMFLEAASAAGALTFGEFTLKSGRISPYFFNAGMFCTGKSLAALSAAYADRLIQSGIEFDMLFGPAYKGIALAAATAEQLYLRHSRDVGFCYNRKEAKVHGEGGVLVGAKLAGRVVIIDDVISAGTSVRQSVEIIRAAGAMPSAVLIALDRAERGSDAASQLSAAGEVSLKFQIPVLAVASLEDLLSYVQTDCRLVKNRDALLAYRAQFGAN